MVKYTYQYQDEKNNILHTASFAAYDQSRL